MYTFSPFNTVYKSYQPSNFLDVNLFTPLQRIQYRHQILRFLIPLLICTFCQL